MKSVLPQLSYGSSTKVVLIGTTAPDTADDTLPPLPHVRENVERLSRVFQDPDVIGLGPDDIIKLLDEPFAGPTVARIAEEGKTVQDTLVVYYAGHGLRGDLTEPLYLCARETSYASRKYTGIAVSKLREAIADSNAQRRILILDCCFAGAGLPGAMSDTDLVDAVEHNIDIAGTYAMAAVPANRKALAPPDEEVTKFTGALLDVLENGVKDAEAILSIESIFDSLHQRFHLEAMPLPQRTNWKDGDHFLFARNRFFDQDDLAQLKVAVKGLQDTVTDYGLRIQALGDKLSHHDERLQAMIAPPQDPIDGEAQGERPGIWTDLGAREAEWCAWPDEVRRAIFDRRDAIRNGKIMVIFGGFATFLALVKYFLLYLSNMGRIDFYEFDSLDKILMAIFVLLVVMLTPSYGALLHNKPRMAVDQMPSEDPLRESYRVNANAYLALRESIPRVLGIPFQRTWLLGFCLLATFFCLLVANDFLPTVLEYLRPSTVQAR